MGGGNDHRYPPRDVSEGRFHQGLTFRISKCELLGEIGKNAQAVGACVNHEVQTATLSFKIERAVVMENRRNHRKDSAVGTLKGGHHDLTFLLFDAVISRRSGDVSDKREPS